MPRGGRREGAGRPVGSGLKPDRERRKTPPFRLSDTEVVEIDRIREDGESRADAVMRAVRDGVPPNYAIGIDRGGPDEVVVVVCRRENGRIAVVAAGRGEHAMQKAIVAAMKLDPHFAQAIAGRFAISVG